MTNHLVICCFHIVVSLWCWFVSPQILRQLIAFADATRKAHQRHLELNAARNEAAANPNQRIRQCTALLNSIEAHGKMQQTQEELISAILTEDAQNDDQR